MAQYLARSVVDRLALALQGSLLLRSGDADVAEAFCASRLTPHGVQNYGCLPSGIRCDRIIERATPVV